MYGFFLVFRRETPNFQAGADCGLRVILTLMTGYGLQVTGVIGSIDEDCTTVLKLKFA